MDNQIHQDSKRTEQSLQTCNSNYEIGHISPKFNQNIDDDNLSVRNAQLYNKKEDISECDKILIKKQDNSYLSKYNDVMPTYSHKNKS